MWRTSIGCLIYLVVILEICTKPSILCPSLSAIPISTNAPKSIMFLTVPSSSSPGCKSSKWSCSLFNSGLSKSSRGSRLGVLIYLITSSKVYLSVFNSLTYLF